MATEKTTLKLSLPEARDVLATLWVSGGQPDQRLRKQVGYDLKAVDLALSGAISILRSKGKLRAETARDGTPLLVLGPGDGTLRDIVEPFDASAEVASSTKTWVRQALHSWFALPETSLREDLYAACEKVSILDVYELPESVYQSAVAAGHAVKKAPSWKSALRAAMTWAAKQPRFTIALPEEWCRIDDELTTRTVRALARVWSDGREPSKEAIQEAGGPAPGSVSRRFNEMVARDLAAVQPHVKGGVTLLWINFSDHC